MISFKNGETIREVKTGKPFIVIQHFRSAVMIGALEESEVFHEPRLIYETDYDKFEPDYNFDQKGSNGHTHFVKLVLTQLPATV